MQVRVQPVETVPEDAGGEWSARPVLGWFVRVLLVAIPIAVSWLSVRALVVLHPRPAGWWPTVGWVAAALAVESARPFARAKPPPECFAAALLHDVGVGVLARQLGQDEVELLERGCREGGQTLLESERELLEVNHGEVGGLVAAHWGLSPVVVEGIVFHHEPEAAPSAEGRLVADFVALADIVAGLIGASIGEERARGPHPGLLGRLGIDRTGFEGLVREGRARVCRSRGSELALALPGVAMVASRAAPS